MSNFRKPYQKHENHPIFFEGKSRAKQSFKDECNINNIMAKYQNTGLLEHLNTSSPRYGDFSSVASYQQSLNAVIAAQDAFEALPSAIRKRFANDPAQLLRFIEDDANREEAVRLGLINPPEPVPAPQAAQQRPEGTPVASLTPQTAPAQPVSPLSAEQRPAGA